MSAILKYTAYKTRHGTTTAQTGLLIKTRLPLFFFIFLFFQIRCHFLALYGLAPGDRHVGRMYSAQTSRRLSVATAHARFMVSSFPTTASSDTRYTLQNFSHTIFFFQVRGKSTRLGLNSITKPSRN